MKVLVTGGAGFIGSNLIEKLIQNNNLIITSLDNYISGKKSNHIIHKNVTYIEGNTWDSDKIFNDCQFDIVFHFGEYSRINKSFENIKILHKSIFVGTPCILELVRKWNAKLIYSATSAGLNDKENLSPYSWMKNKMTELIKNYNKWYNINYHLCYFYNVYGGDKEISEGDFSTVVAIFKKQYLNNSELTIVKPGTQERFFTHVNDIVDALIKVMKSNYINESWFLSHYKSYSINEVALMFNHKYKYIEERKGERYIPGFVDTKTYNKLNWIPKYNLENYINEIIY